MLMDKIRELIEDWDVHIRTDDSELLLEVMEALKAVDDVLKKWEPINNGNIFTSGMVSIKLIRKAIESTDKE